MKKECGTPRQQQPHHTPSPPPPHARSERVSCRLPTNKQGQRRAEVVWLRSTRAAKRAGVAVRLWGRQDATSGGIGTLGLPQCAVDKTALGCWGRHGAQHLVRVHQRWWRASTCPGAGTCKRGAPRENNKAKSLAPGTYMCGKPARPTESGCQGQGRAAERATARAGGCASPYGRVITS